MVNRAPGWVVGIDRMASSIVAACSRVRARTSTRAEARAATTFEVVPPFDHADVDRHAPGQVGQGLESEDQPGQFLDRADALLDLDPGVGGPPLDLEDEVADPLAGGLQRAVGQGGLQDEGAGALPGPILDQPTRGRAADLLVRGQQKVDGPGGAESEISQRVDREIGEDEARLHVEDARPVRPVALDPERHPGQRPRGPDGVVVSQDEDRLPDRPLAEEPGQEVVAAVGVGEPLDFPADRPTTLGQPGCQAIERRLVATGGLELDQLPEGPQPLGPAGPHHLEDLWAGHEVGFREDRDGRDRLCWKRVQSIKSEPIGPPRRKAVSESGMASGHSTTPSRGGTLTRPSATLSPGEREFHASLSPGRGPG